MCGSHGENQTNNGLLGELADHSTMEDGYIIVLVD